MQLTQNKRRIFPIAVLLLAGVALALFNHFTFRIGYGMPGGEIDFTGLGKADVIQKIIAEKLVQTIDIDGRNTRAFGSLNEALSDGLIMKSDKWGVNYRQAGMIMYRQLLFFNKEGRVCKQSLGINIDGP